MNNERLLKLAGIQLNEQPEQSDKLRAAVDAVTIYLIEVMERVNQDTRGDFGGSNRPQDVLDNVLKQISSKVSVKYTQNTVKF